MPGEVRFTVTDATIGGKARKVLRYRNQPVRLAGPAEDAFRTLPLALAQAIGARHQGFGPEADRSERAAVTGHARASAMASSVCKPPTPATRRRIRAGSSEPHVVQPSLGGRNGSPSK